MPQRETLNNTMRTDGMINKTKKMRKIIENRKNQENFLTIDGDASVKLSGSNIKLIEPRN